MPNRTAVVDRFLADLDHPHAAAVARLRLAILGSDPDVTEQIKWKAPSFCYRGVDRVTFRLRPAPAFQLVLHRGVQVRTDAAGFAFADATGLLRWVTADRAVLDLDGVPDADVVDLVGRWMAVE